METMAVMTVPGCYSLDEPAVRKRRAAKLRRASESERHCSAVLVEGGFDIANRSVDDLAHALHRFWCQCSAAPHPAKRLKQAAEPLHDVAEVLDVRLPGVFLEALVEVGHLFAVCVQISPTKVSDLVHLAIVLLHHASVAELLEHLQRRVDHSGARAVRTAAALFDDLNDFVAVPRLFGERVEHEVAHATALSTRRG